jgi:hypothetical protein
LRIVFLTAQMADSANKDDVSNKVQTDDVASSETPDDAKPDEQTASAEAQAMAKHKLFDQLVKEAHCSNQNKC